MLPSFASTHAVLAYPRYPSFRSSLSSEIQCSRDIKCNAKQPSITNRGGWPRTSVSRSSLLHWPTITDAKSLATPSAEEQERSVDLVSGGSSALARSRLGLRHREHVLRKPGGVFVGWTFSNFQSQPCPEFAEELHRWFGIPRIYRAGVRQKSTISFPACANRS